MKNLITIICVIFSLSLMAQQPQQVIKMCDENLMAFEYSTSSSLGGSYSWTIDGLNSGTTTNGVLNHNWENASLGIHTIEVSTVSPAGCGPVFQTYEVNLLECDNSSLYAPNAFTPDGDQYNNVWLPIGYNFSDLHFMIFNRWGELIFESQNPTIGWDGTYKGTLCKSDVYVYKIAWKAASGKRCYETGHVTLLR
jgi:gliding motility-associated-like protein